MDPRIERSQDRVRTAVIELIASRGYGGLTIEAVTELSGVAKSTIYRHWTDKLTLITDSLESSTPSLEAAPTANVRQELWRLLDHATAALHRSKLASCAPAIIAAATYEPNIQRWVQMRHTGLRRQLVDAIQRGIRSSDLPQVDVDVAADALLGYLVQRRLTSPSQPTGDQINNLLDQLFPPSTTPHLGKPTGP